MDIKTLIVILSAILILVLFALFMLKKHMSVREDLFENMEGEEFEEYCAALLEDLNYEDVKKTAASHDFGIDIFAKRDGISYAIQCKCYCDPVGIKAVQEAYAGRDYYDCMVAVVMTNQNFTGPAKQFAEKLNVLLWDKEVIEDMVNSRVNNR